MTIQESMTVRLANGIAGSGKLLLVSLLVLMMTAVTVSAQADQTGKISGKIVDKENGDPMVGVTVMVKGTSLGAMTDVDGRYTITRIPVGTHDLLIRAVGYQELTVTDVEVSDGKAADISASMRSQAIETGETITVTAKQIKRTEAALLAERKKSTGVSDAISAEQISKSGAGDAADAMTKVTGATVADGKFVYVRGLGDRYTNTNMNGSPLPSLDPDNQNVPLDLIPTGLLDNIVVQKTFTPDKQGNFTGGSVDMTTRDFPEYRQISFSTSLSMNSVATGKDLIAAQEGDGDWAATGADFRALPDELQNAYEAGSGGTLIWRGNRSDTLNPEKAAQTAALLDLVERGSESLNPTMIPSLSEGPLGQKYSLSYGDQLQLFDRPLGILATASWGTNISGYNDGIKRRYEQGTTSDQGNLLLDHDFTERIGSREVLWGSLVNLRYSIHPNHKLGFNLVRNQSGENRAGWREGLNPEKTAEIDDLYRTRTLQYTERSLSSYQFSGEHYGFFGSSARLEWQVSYAEGRQQDPDLRRFADVYEGSGWTSDPTITDEISRLWRDMDERTRNYQVDLMIPLGQNSRFKTGGFLTNRDRNNLEREFEYVDEGGWGDFDNEYDYFTYLGIDSAKTRALSNGDTLWYFKNYVVEKTVTQNNFTGSQDIKAAYAMVDFPAFNRLRIIGGARLEKTDQKIVSGFSQFADIFPDIDTTASINETDWLPSANLVYGATDNMNVRLAYGRTLARPNFREMSNAYFQEFAGGRTYLGNDSLQRTLIDNVDLRWEWFVRPGELFAISGFYKKFRDPIEETIVSVNGDIQWQNAPDATMYGLELEFRRRLDHAWSKLKYFVLGGNFTLVNSEIELTSEELATGGFEPGTTRPMVGQSPYIINLDVGYDNPILGTSITLLYNRFGKRLAFNSESRTPDIYEQPRDQLDVISSQRVWGGMQLKLGVKNLLGDSYKFTYEPEELGISSDQEYIWREYYKGRTWTIGMTYTL